MPSYSSNSSSNQADSSSSGSSYNFGSNFAASQGSGSSQSGSQYVLSPQQQSWVSALYPGVKQRFDRLNPPQGAQGAAPYMQQASRTITAGPVWTPQQIQGQVNLADAQGDQSTATQQRQLASTLGGRGYGSNSPLYQSLSGNMQQQNLAQKTSAENNLRWNAAQGNAQQLLAGQTAQGNLGSSLYQTDYQGQVSQMNALLQALMFFNTPRPTSASRSQQSQASVSQGVQYGGSQQGSDSSQSGGGNGYSYSGDQFS